MQGELLRKTRPQAQKEYKWRQKKFGGGLSQDKPASALASNEMAVLENFVSHDDYLEGRSGTQIYSNTALPGSGTIYGWKQHPTTKKHLLHRGTGLWIADAAMTSWTEITSIAAIFFAPIAEIAGDTGSQLAGFPIGIIGVNTSNSNNGVLYWTLANSGSTRTLNIYKESGHSNLVASGSRVGNGALYVYMSNNSGIYIPSAITVTYSGDDTDASNTLTVDTTYLETSFNNNASTKIIPYKNDFLVFANAQASANYSAITFINTTDNKFYALNADDDSSRPKYALSVTGTQAAATPYGRRYLYSFSRIVNSSGAADYSLNRTSGNLIFEGPTTNIVNYGSSIPGTDYSEAWFANPVSVSNANSITITNGNNSPAAHFTHYSLYGTLDIGVNGVDPANGIGNSKEVYVWIADISIDQRTYSDTTTDEKLRARLASDFTLKTRFWAPMPKGACADIAGAFVYTGERTKNRISYCQLSNPQHIGFYREDLQFLTVDDGIQEIKNTSDTFVILCSKKTYASSPRIYDNASVLEAVYVIKNITPISKNTGVIDYGSIADIDDGAFIAHCSDHTIRAFVGLAWGAEDYADSLISKEVATIQNGSAAGYFSGVYLLWYRTASGINTKCLRLGINKKAGQRWSKCTGAAFPFPQTYVGPNTIHDANDVQRLIVLDNASGLFHWVETFDGYTGSNLSKVYLDAVATAGTGGTAVVPKARFSEFTGEDEGETVYLRSAHVYTRPSATSLPSGYAMTIRCYVDGATTASATLANAHSQSDIQFFERLTGARLQIEVEFATSGFKIVSLDASYQAHDTAAIGSNAAQNDDATAQGYLAGTTMKHWLTRPKNLRNRATGTDYTLTGTAPANVTGPDGKSYGLSFVSGASYSQADTTSYSDFSVCIWVKTADLNSRIFQLTGSSSFYVRFTSNTVMDVNGAGNITVNTIASGWHQFWIIRNGSTITVYQAGVLLAGTVTVAGAVGGTSVQVNQGTGAVSLFDFRVYSSALVVATILYSYSDINGNTGTKILPIV